jgi:CHAT domain/Cytosol aminopeptidase family, N-terminal domain/PGAP1-like protein
MPAYLETEQELSRLARRAAGMRGGPRLLILPGVMGSSIGRLRKGGGADVTWFDPVEIAQGQLVKLALPGGNRYWAIGVLKFAYERLRLVLRIAGFDAVFHPYDWRRDMLWNGRELADRLLREKRQEVIVVGHSMGGLVARAALAHKGGERIARVIQLGAPNKGTFVSVQALRGTYPLIRRVAMLDLKHSADELAREMLTTFPGLCDLLPAASLCKDFDPFDPAQWPDGPKPEANLLVAAREAIKRLPPPDNRFRLVAGFGQDTVLGLRRSGRKLEFGRGPAGDGTVPLALAQWPGLQTWYAEESHGSLPGNADVGRAVADLARNGSTNALPRVLPQRRGVPTLWQEEVRAASEPKVAWGDLSEREQREFLHEFVGVTLPSTAAAAPKRDAAAKPVELSFMEGSITHSAAAAIVLGAFANVEPAGAAQDIDRLLHGAISDLARRRAINAAAGEVFVLPVARGGLVPRLVVFAGLGHFARYNPDVQRLAAANVTRTLALAGIENFAMVLWGTTSGTGPADAARAQLEGVLTALADLGPEPKLKRITIVSRDAGRIAEARRVAEDLLRLHPAAPLLKIARERKSTRKPAKPPKQTATPLAWLFVQESAATLRAALLGPAPKATALVASRRLDHRLLEREHSRLVPGMTLGDLADFGERLSGLLLPPEIAEALPSVKSAPLVVVHDTASAHWPWEVLSLGGWAPAAAKGLSRRYAAEGMSVAKWREQRRRAREFNVLLVVNPTGDLPGAVEEGERVAAMLTQLPGAGITAIRGADATRARLLAEFRSGDYDAIHFAGHAWFDAAAPASSGILCTGGRVLSGADLAAMDSVPALVFFNACESGRLRATVNPLRQLDRSVGFAEAFLRGGVANFIGTWWPVSDHAASAFAAALYRDLARGESIGAALNAARGAVRAVPSADWANYLHYGSYDFTLKAAKD